jgi:hypothetical protein
VSRENNQRREMASVVAGLIAVAAVGCGAGTVIDERAAEIDVREGFDELGVRVRSVECPADVEVERGALYACRAHTARGAFRVLYRQLDEDGSVGRPRLERIPEAR